MVQIREGASVINLNESQSKVKLVNPNVLYGLFPRAGGKTYLIGDRIEHLSDVMPRSQVLLFSDTYKRLDERIVPNILNYFINEAGMTEGEDFVVFKKPPEHWKKPLIPLKEFEHVISFTSGLAVCCASQMVPGSANAYNAQALIVDEAKYIEEKVINTEVLPALRGARKFFGHLPEYRSHWYFTDKYGENIKWLLAKKKYHNEKVINAIITEQQEIYRLQDEMEQYSSSSTRYKYQNLITLKEARLQKVRRNLVYYCSASAYENIEALGEKYFRDLKRDLTAYEYEISVENKDPDTVQNTFYPALSTVKHCHSYMNDTNPNRPLIASMDYQWRITPMVVSQLDFLPHKEKLTLNTVNGIHTLHPDGGIIQTVRSFCVYYQDHAEKIVYYLYDHTAIARRPDGVCFKDLAVKEWITNGWIVIEKNIGAAPAHDLKHEEIKQIMLSDQITFNEVRAWAPLKSIRNAGAVKSGSVTKKDKSQEKKLNNDPIEQTDYSDAYDTQVYGVLKLKLVLPQSHSFLGDMSIK